VQKASGRERLGLIMMMIGVTKRNVAWFGLRHIQKWAIAFVLSILFLVIPKFVK
jgi:hypothetical protein